MPDIGLLMCGHGTRHVTGAREFVDLAAKVGRGFQHWSSAHGFLEFATPTIIDGLQYLVEEGAKTVIAVPALLFAARHANNDIPSVLHRHLPAGIELRYAKPLGFDPKVLRAAADRIEAAEAAATPGIERRDTLLLVAGRGTSDPDANSDLAKLSRMLCEGMKFGWGETCYSGVTEPQTAKALEQAAKLGYARIVVLPYFLSTGALVQRVYTATDEAARAHPGIEFVKAPYLGDHPLVIETFCERIIDALEQPHGHVHHHGHDHGHEECDEEWHNHAPDGAAEPNDVFSLAPRNSTSR